MRSRCDAVAGMLDISTSLLTYAVHEGALIVPKLDNLGFGCKTTPWGGVGIRSITGKIVLGWDTAKELHHSLFIASTIVQKDGYSNCSFHHDFSRDISLMRDEAR